MEDSIFYKFAKGELKPDKIRFEDDKLLAFDDINPNAPTHILIIPKNRNLRSIVQMTSEDTKLLGSMIYRAKLLADELGLAENGYRLTINVGKWGGQVVPYLHLHLLGGAQLSGDLSQFTKAE
ncbi:histidine triad nucleotide-binding protein [candidate division Kazan bacterium]|uniref:Histidine triad nucleotide-binding protein n=1 Tax=candidate division Kazan bacterium TaxID=2202143 RepID=A0A420ZBI1_UNCK3|nr:MAG: histidine triad nucleotide-binding protein [candidate division Kazan bacterium]